MAVSPTAPLARFWRFVQEEGDCLIWTGNFVGSKSQYPRFRLTTRAADPQVYAHRWIYEQMVGPIPEGMELDHVKARGCVGSRCVNWLHLEPVTPSENSFRARLKTCKNGHDLSIDGNCRWDAQGRRRGCLVCKQNQVREYDRTRQVRV